eukprot:GHRQ01014244.1.p3 GENE.GHRQ01014244.1~~GHRQ01014244.1.p3  ORF type:complete len:100 (-),score=26.15 GHRQ01014244.1:387-686(-)
MKQKNSSEKQMRPCQLAALKRGRLPAAQDAAQQQTPAKQRHAAPHVNSMAELQHLKGVGWLHANGSTLQAARGAEESLSISSATRTMRTRNALSSEVGR